MQKTLQTILLSGALAILATPYPTIASGGRDNDDNGQQQSNNQNTSVVTGNNSQQQSNNQNTNVTTGNNSQQQRNNQENNQSNHQSNNQSNEQSNNQNTNVTTGSNVSTVNSTTNVSTGSATNNLSTGPVSNSNTNNTGPVSNSNTNSTGAVSNSNTNNYISYPDWINVAPSQAAVSIDSVTCQGPTLTATASTLTTNTSNNQYGVQGAFGFSVPIGGQADCNAVQTAIRKRAVVENSVRVALACKQLEASGIEVDATKFPDLAICSSK